MLNYDHFVLLWHLSFSCANAKENIELSIVYSFYKKVISNRNRCLHEAPPGTACAVKIAGNRNSERAAARTVSVVWNANCAQRVMAAHSRGHQACPSLYGFSIRFTYLISRMSIMTESWFIIEYEGLNGKCAVNFWCWNCNSWIIYQFEIYCFGFERKRKN